MDSLVNAVITGLLLAAAVYAHLRLEHHTATRRQALIARTILVLVGLGFGWTATLWLAHASVWVKLSGFLAAFGMVHVPAAVILYIKRRRGVYQ
ncbi:MAG TPA: hypothetical protein VIR60_09540 [Gammaproteobacteria bacterium]